MDTYDSKTASRIVGVSLRQIQYWDERGFLRPSVQLAGGRGTKRLYSFQDLLCLKVLKDLVRCGFNLQRIRRCLRPLRQYHPETIEPSRALRYLTDGEKLFMITSNRKKILHAMEHQFILSLGIGEFVHELNGAAGQDTRPGRRRPGHVRDAAERRSGRA